MTTLSDTLLAAVEDASRLAPWAERNAVAREDERVDAAVRRALTGPVPDECAIGVPLLRFADTRVPAAPLLDVLVVGAARRAVRCDLCDAKVRSTFRLLVPAGASIVAVHCCFFCRDVLQDVFDCGLEWA